MNKNDSKALDSFYSQCILNGFQTHFEWVSLVSGRISMHFQVIFNGIWKEFQLVLEGISIDFKWISMLFGWSAMHFGWISNACSMDFQLCCLVVGMLSSLRGIKKTSDPGEIVHLSGMVLPSGCCLVVGMLACRMHFE